MSFAPRRYSPRVQGSPRRAGSEIGISNGKADALDKLPTEDLMHLKRSIDEKLYERRGVGAHHHGDGLSQGRKLQTQNPCLTFFVHHVGCVVMLSNKPFKLVAQLCTTQAVLMLNAFCDHHINPWTNTAFHSRKFFKQHVMPNTMRYRDSILHFTSQWPEISETQKMTCFSKRSNSAVRHSAAFHGASSKNDVWRAG
jgi:hypothetical protein